MKTTILLFLVALNCYKVSAQIPHFSWVKSTGSIDHIIDGKSITVDKMGNSYVLGTFEGMCDMDPASTKLYLNSKGTYDIYVSKFSNKGDLLWSKQIVGSEDYEAPRGIKVDHLGNVYITGWLLGTMDFDPSTKANNLTSNGGTDIFLLKLNTNGEFVWVKQIGSALNEQVSDIEMDSLENVYLLGNFESTFNANPSSLVVNNLSYSQGNIFIIKLNNNGQLVWANNFGGPNATAKSIKVDNKNNVYCVGSFSDYADFDPSDKVYKITPLATSLACEDNAFVLKLDDLGNFLWAKSFGSKNKTYASSVVIDNDFNVYISGNFDKTCDFDPNTSVYNLTSNGYNDGFITKWDSLGNFYWAHKLGGALYGDQVCQLNIDQSNNIYALGLFNGLVDFGLGKMYSPLTSKGVQDSYILKMDPKGLFIDAQSFYGYSNAFEIQDNGDLFITGYYSNSGDFDPDASRSNIIKSVGITDAFTLKLSDNILSVLDDKKPNKIFTVYPNPSNSIFTISIPESMVSQNIKIYNSNGLIISQQEITNGISEINLSSYPNGVYFIECFLSGTSIGIQKIIKQ